jgi:exonuclease SbcD
MRMLHTSDWHLGRLFFGTHLTEDQAHVLDQLIALAVDYKAHVVLVSGDVFDRAVPPVEAVELLNHVLCRLVLDHEIPVIMIPGNHDSATRLGFAADALARTGLHVVGELDSADPVVIEDEHGPVEFFPLPYAEPALVRDRLNAAQAVDHNAAMAVQTKTALERRTKGRRAVALAHAFVAGGVVTESERPLSVGGTGAVQSNVFDGFDYIALGHLHRPQAMDSGRINYAGSLLQYSFSEIRDTKSVSLVEMDAHGKTSLERVNLSPRRMLRLMEGNLKDLLEADPSDDYFLVRLNDQGALLDPMGRLRKVFPNVVHLERPFLHTASGDARADRDYRRQTMLDLFSDFFSQVTGRELNTDEHSALMEVVEAAEETDRED